jgi:hypothetical protein
MIMLLLLGLIGSGYYQHETIEDSPEAEVEEIDEAYETKMRLVTMVNMCRQYGVHPVKHYNSSLKVNKLTLQSINTTAEYYPETNEYRFLQRDPESEVWSWNETGEVKRVIDFVIAIK